MVPAIVWWVTDPASVAKKEPGVKKEPVVKQEMAAEAKEGAFGAEAEEKPLEFPAAPTPAGSEPERAGAGGSRSEPQPARYIDKAARFEILSEITVQNDQSIDVKEAELTVLLKGLADDLPEDLFNEKYEEMAEEDMDSIERQLTELGQTGRMVPGSAVHHMWQKAARSTEMRQAIETAGRGHEVGRELKRKWAAAEIKTRIQKKKQLERASSLDGTEGSYQTIKQVLDAQGRDIQGIKATRHLIASCLHRAASGLLLAVPIYTPPDRLQPLILHFSFVWRSWRGRGRRSRPQRIWAGRPACHLTHSFFPTRHRERERERGKD